jgi:gp16 family phage-associated protein
VKKPKSTKVLTPHQAKERLRLKGITAAEFARREGLSAQAVYEVLNGRQPGRYGEAHRAAVALGLKPAL